MSSKTFAASLVTLFLAGVGLFIYGSSLPAYHDAAAAERLLLSATGGGQCGGEAWYRAMDALRTWREPLMNGGAALILIVGTLTALLAPHAGTRLAELRSPSSTIWYFVLGTGTTIFFFLASAVSFVIDLGRGHFPPCADSIGIPIAETLYGGTVILAALLGAGALVSLAFGELPVPLWIWDRSRPVRSWAWTILSALALVLLGLIIVTAIPTATFLAVPPCLVGAYLVLAARAAVLAPKVRAY